MGVKYGLTELYLVILAQALLFAQNVSSEENTIHVGVYILYDREIYKQITDDYGHDYWAKRGNPNDYFTAFLKGVEMRFRNMSENTVKISLVNATLLNDNRALEVEVSAPGYYETLNGSETMRKLKQELSHNSEMYAEGDAMFFVTTRSVLREEVDNKWHGMASQGGICKDVDKAGLVTDDGKTFTGVQDTALQLALLLNASRDGIDNNCNNTDLHLLSTIYTGVKSYLSTCSRDDIEKFLKEEPQKCLETQPATIASSEANLPSVYHNLTGFDVCTSGTTARWREVKECEPGVVPTRGNYTCHKHCCEYNSRYTIHNGALSLGWRREADGTTCGSGQICITGKCEYASESL